MSFIIDGNNFTDYVNFISLKRSADFLDKFAKRNTQGDLRRELIGVFINYQLEIGVFQNTSKYNELWDILTRPVPFHSIILPSNTGNYSFTAYVSNVKDTGLRIRQNGNTFYGLTIDFIAKSPYRRA